MYEVKDGSRTLQFSGTKLGSSSSWTSGSTRWIEFELYKTDSGAYVISRIGVSVVYHGAACDLVARYHLTEAEPQSLSADAIPCVECNPTRGLPYVFPEKDRTWGHVTQTPGAVVAALYKQDYNKNLYLTKVAKRLLEAASDNDDQLDMVYRIEIIP